MNAVESISHPKTEGIKYAGSKLRLIPHILKLADSTGARSVLDAFSGTTRVSQAFAARGWKVASNDIADWSRVFAVCFLQGGPLVRRCEEIIGHLNSLEERDGWFTENYGGPSSTNTSFGSDDLKKPFQRHNTRKLDAIREEIDRMGLGEVEKSVALTSLILALDRVDSTLGHFASYLREWSPRSKNTLKLKLPRIMTYSRKHKVLQQDAFDAVENEDSQLAYLDPPYGSNNPGMPPSRVRYAAYYHFWKTVVLNDRPELFGKAKRRADSGDTANLSPFEDFRRTDAGDFVAGAAIARLIRKCRSEFVLFSYSSGGRVPHEDIVDSLRSEGELLRAVEIDHKRNVMSSMCRTGEWTSDENPRNREFLFLIRK